MEGGLRIQIPRVYYCRTPSCQEFFVNDDLTYCRKCSHSGMREEVATTALASETEIVHSPPLSGYRTCGCQVH